MVRQFECSRHSSVIAWILAQSPIARRQRRRRPTGRTPDRPAPPGARAEARRNRQAARTAFFEGPKHMRRLTYLGVIVAVSVLAACSSSSSSTPPTNTGPSGTLTIDNESGGNWTCDFNPFISSDTGFSLGAIYEPLVFLNVLQNQKATPMLASSYA